MAELSNVELNTKEMYRIIITNLNKLFIRRNYTNNKQLDTELPEKVINSIINEKLYNFELEGKKLSINIYNQDLKNISQNSPIDDYLSKNIDTQKFLIVKSFSKKTYAQVTKDYKNAEIFTIYEMLEDIPAKEIIPQHILLDNDEKKELLESFGLNELGRIYSTDMMARYYGAKINDVFRIIRPNLNSGMSIYYRLVVPGSQEIFSM